MFLLLSQGVKNVLRSGGIASQQNPTMKLIVILIPPLSHWRYNSGASIYFLKIGKKNLILQLFKG
jgi:hypothetical protein